MAKMKMVLFWCWLPLCLSAQEVKDRIVYMDSLERVSNEDDYYILRVFKNYYTENPQCEVFDYYKSGKIKRAGTLKNKYSNIKEGTFVGYYENGNKETVISYKDNIPLGKFYSWYEKGTKEIVGEFLKADNPKKPFLKIHQYWSRIGIQRVVDGNGHFQDEDLTSFSEGELKDGFKEGEWYGHDVKMQPRLQKSTNQADCFQAYLSTQRRRHIPTKKSLPNRNHYEAQSILTNTFTKTLLCRFRKTATNPMEGWSPNSKSVRTAGSTTFVYYSDWDLVSTRKLFGYSVITTNGNRQQDEGYHFLLPIRYPLA